MSKKLSLLLSLVFVLSCSHAPSVVDVDKKIPAENSPPTVEEIQFVGKFKAKRAVFNNGLKLVVVEDHSSPTFAWHTWYNVGSRNEKVGYTGLAHFFEHMMFKETKNLKEGEFDKILESAGVEGENAFTSEDYTAYIQELSREHLPLIARLEADRMVNLTISEGSFKSEKEVVQNERRFRTENNPEGLMDQELFNLSFTKHPYHWPVIGYEEDLVRASVKDAEEFYKTYYSPNRATIVVVGDVRFEEVLGLVQLNFGSLYAAQAKDDSKEKDVAQVLKKTKLLKLDIQVEKLLLGFRVPEITHEDAPALEVLQAVLTNGKSGRLYRALVSRGVASSVSSGNHENRDPTLYQISVALQKGKRAKAAERTVLDELKNLSESPIQEQELKRAKNNILYNAFSRLSTNYEKAYYLGKGETIWSDFRRSREFDEKVQKVTSQQLVSVVAKYFTETNVTAIYGAPKK